MNFNEYTRKHGTRGKTIDEVYHEYRRGQRVEPDPPTRTEALLRWVVTAEPRDLAFWVVMLMIIIIGSVVILVWTLGWSTTILFVTVGLWVAALRPWSEDGIDEKELER